MSIVEIKEPVVKVNVTTKISLYEEQNLNSKKILLYQRAKNFH